MSLMQDVIDGLVTVVESTLTDYTVKAFYTPLADLRHDLLPRAMVFDPEGVTTRDVFKQQLQKVAVSVLLVNLPAQPNNEEIVAAVRQDVADILDAVKADTKLGGVTEDLVVETWALHETRETQTVATLLIVATATE